MVDISKSIPSIRFSELEKTTPIKKTSEASASSKTIDVKEIKNSAVNKMNSCAIWDASEKTSSAGSVVKSSTTESEPVTKENAEAKVESAKSQISDGEQTITKVESQQEQCKSKEASVNNQMEVIQSNQADA